VGSIPIAYRHFCLRLSPEKIADFNIRAACGSMGGMRSLFLISLWFCSGPVQAETSTRTFLEQHKGASEDGRRVLIGFLHGLIAGYTWTNVTLKADGRRPLFCLTEQGGRELENPVRLLKNAAGTDPALFESPVGMALLVNLKRRFPCRDKPTQE
jgi:hypothetical protein